MIGTTPPPTDGFWIRNVDRVANVLSPAWGARRKAWRLIAGQVEKLYRAGTRSRLDPAEPEGDGNSLLEAHRAAIVQRARQLERDNFIADGILTRLVENVNGPEGFRLRPRTGDKDTNERLVRRWTRWDELEADVRGMVGFSSGDGIMSHVLRSGLRDGDVVLERRDDGAVAILEADRIETPAEFASDVNVTDGVRVDPETGRPVTFYVCKEDSPSLEFTELAFKHVEFFARRPRSSS